MYTNNGDDMDLKRKYAHLLLDCLNLKKGDYLFVSIPTSALYFKKLIIEEAEAYGLKDIYFDEVDSYKKHDLLKKLDQENINKHPYFDASIYNKYAKLDAGFLFIRSMIPKLMDDVDPVKIKATTEHTLETQKYFRDLYNSSKLRWNISCIPNEEWAKSLNMSEDELWNYILKICMVDEKSNPYEKWNEYLEELEKTTNILNDYNFEYLEYKNDAGTDLKIYLPERHLWSSGKSPNGDICNMPTLEVFTSPLYNKTEGKVVATKPLLFNNVLIDDFYLEFKEGKVVSYDARVGFDTLKTIIETDEYSCYLGECALVSFDSVINKTNIIFNETLYDENASCHIALGRGFNECLRGEVKDDKEQLKRGVNISKTHVDFMIGSRDLSVIGVTHDGNEIKVIENGNIILK